MTSSPEIRRKARARAIEFLFSLEFNQYSWRDALTMFWETFDAKPSVRDYCNDLVEGIITNRATLDETIDSHLSAWSPGRVGRIERAILRLAVFEMRFGDDVPRAVAINEAIELARRYGPDEAPGFVNALLDRIPPEALAS